MVTTMACPAEGCDGEIVLELQLEIKPAEDRNALIIHPSGFREIGTHLRDNHPQVWLGLEDLASWIPLTDYC